MNTFITSQFSYCPLIRMFYDRTINNKIARIQERALRVAYKDNTSRHEKLLENDNSVSIHQKNLQLLMVDIYKTRNHLNPSIVYDGNFSRKGNAVSSKKLEQFKPTKSENHMLWYRYHKMHGSQSMGNITYRSENFSLFDRF